MKSYTFFTMISSENFWIFPNPLKFFLKLPIVDNKSSLQASVFLLIYSVIGFICSIYSAILKTASACIVLE